MKDRLFSAFFKIKQKSDYLRPITLKEYLLTDIGIYIYVLYLVCVLRPFNWFVGHSLLSRFFISLKVYPIIFISHAIAFIIIGLLNTYVMTSRKGNWRVKQNIIVTILYVCILSTLIFIFNSRFDFLRELDPIFGVSILDFIYEVLLIAIPGIIIFIVGKIISMEEKEALDFNEGLEKIGYAYNLNKSRRSLNITIPIDANNTIVENNIEQPEDSKITSEEEKQTSDIKILLKSESGENILALFPEQLYLIEAEGNYIKVYWRNLDNKIERTLLRFTIGAVEELLQPFSQFFRIHRSFIINVQYVQYAKGNLRGMSLKLSLLDIDIPVSRNSIKTFKEKFFDVNKYEIQ